ncbi:hypothetical protein DENSPDRAFT_527491 [Dentipellis sp. KUC8613]|nr:hypothetical protein DENSPDRAFT_527491 [Dentipellis sp. KUC8613]
MIICRPRAVPEPDLCKSLCECDAITCTCTVPAHTHPLGPISSLDRLLLQSSLDHMRDRETQGQTLERGRARATTTPMTSRGISDRGEALFWPTEAQLPTDVQPARHPLPCTLLRNHDSQGLFSRVFFNAGIPRSRNDMGRSWKCHQCARYRWVVSRKGNPSRKRRRGISRAAAAASPLPDIDPAGRHMLTTSHHINQTSTRRPP